MDDTVIWVIAILLFFSLIVAFTGDSEDCGWEGAITRICTGFFTMFMTLTAFSLVIIVLWPALRLYLLLPIGGK